MVARVQNQRYDGRLRAIAPMCCPKKEESRDTLWNLRY